MNFFKLSVIIATMLLLSGCSKNKKMSRLLQQIPANTEFVAVGNMNVIIKSMGGSTEDTKITLPKYLVNMMNSRDEEEIEKINSFIKQSGVDIDACAVFFNYDAATYPIVVFSLLDRQKFINTIEDEGFREKDASEGVSYYLKKTYESSYDPEFDDYSYIAVGKEFGYWIMEVRRGSSFKPLKVFENIAEDLKDGSFGDTPFAKYIKKGNMMGVVAKTPKKAMINEYLPQIGDIPIGAVCMYGDAGDDVLSIHTKCMDQDGKAIDNSTLSKYFDTEARINPDALSYLGRDECMIFAMSVKNFNWDKFLDLLSQVGGMSRSDRSKLSAVTSYMEKIDGTIAAGIGVTDGLDSFFGLVMGHQPLSQISATLVVETKDGKAKTLLNDLMGLMESEEVPYRESSNGFEVSLDGAGTLYAKSEGNMLIFSSHPIKQNSNNDNLKSIDFGDYIAAMACVLSHKNKLLSDLDINNDFKLVALSNAEKSESSLHLEVTGGRSDDSVLEKLIKSVINVVEQQESIERRYLRYRDNVYERLYDYDSYVDEEIVEEVVDTAAVDSVAAEVAEEYYE